MQGLRRRVLHRHEHAALLPHKREKLNITGKPRGKDDAVSDEKREQDHLRQVPKRYFCCDRRQFIDRHDGEAQEERTSG